MQKVAARRRQQRQQGASESRAQICKGRCSKQRQEAGRGARRGEERVAAAEKMLLLPVPLLTVLAKAPKAKVLLATTQSRAAVVQGKRQQSVRGDGRSGRGRGRGSLA